MEKIFLSMIIMLDLSGIYSHIKILETFTNFKNIFNILEIVSWFIGHDKCMIVIKNHSDKHFNLFLIEIEVISFRFPLSLNTSENCETVKIECMRTLASSSHAYNGVTLWGRLAIHEMIGQIARHKLRSPMGQPCPEAVSRGPSSGQWCCPTGWII